MACGWIGGASRTAAYYWQIVQVSAGVISRRTGGATLTAMRDIDIPTLADLNRKDAREAGARAAVHWFTSRALTNNSMTGSLEEFKHRQPRSPYLDIFTKALVPPIGTTGARITRRLAICLSRSWRRPRRSTRWGFGRLRPARGSGSNQATPTR